jgi:hypothetical protein
MSNIQALGSLMCEVSVGVRDRALLEHVLLFKLRKALVGWPAYHHPIHVDPGNMKFSQIAHHFAICCEIVASHLSFTAILLV